MKRTISLVLAVAFLAAATPFALAGDKGERKSRAERAWEHALEKFDKNGDGAISKEEIEEVRAAEKAAHANQPKREKPQPAPNARHKRHHHPHVHLLRDFDKIDTNHDGKISKDEFEAAWREAVEEARRENRQTPAPPK